MRNCSLHRRSFAFNSALLEQQRASRPDAAYIAQNIEISIAINNLFDVKFH